MLHGFHFVIKDKDLQMLNMLPRNFEIYMNNVGINIVYHFKYQITDWKTWNKLARIRASMQKMIPDIVWKDYVYQDCTIKCLESDFNNVMDNDIKFYTSPAINDGERKSVLSALGIECKSLWYQKYFFIEKVIAYSLWLSATYKDNKNVSQSNRQSIQRAMKAYYSFDKIKENYKQRMNDDERKEAYAKRVRKSNPLKEEALELLLTYSVKEVSQRLSIPTKTLYRWKSMPVRKDK